MIMQGIDRQTELLKSVSQLIPSPDIYGVRRKIEASTERDRIEQLLKSGMDKAFFVKNERRKCVVLDPEYLKTSCENGNHLFALSLLPNVKICLYQGPLSQERLVSEDEEVLFCGFLEKLGYHEVTIHPSSQFDRIETRLFSLPNEGKPDEERTDPPCA